MPISFENLRNVINRAGKEARRQEVFETAVEEQKKASKSKPKSKKKRKHYTAAFAPLLYRGNLGTPKAGPLGPYWGSSGGPGQATSPGGAPGSNGSAPPAAPAGPVASSWAPPTRSRVLHEMKKAMGLLEYSAGTGAAASAWQGFAMPNPLSVNIRQGGPTIGGPGFGPNQDDMPSGGVYDPAKSPGLGFRSEQAWRVWKAALEIMERDKAIPLGAILQASFQRANVKMTEMDPAEVRLVEMGIQWFLSDPVPYASKRDTGDGGAGNTVQPVSQGPSG